MDLLAGGTPQLWSGGWAMAFIYGASNLQMSPDNGSTWFEVPDGAGNPITGLADTAVVAVLPKGVLVQAVGGTKITLVRGYTNTRSAGG